MSRGISYLHYLVNIYLHYHYNFIRIYILLILL